MRWNTEVSYKSFVYRILGLRKFPQLLSSEDAELAESGDDGEDDDDDEEEEEDSPQVAAHFWLAEELKQSVVVRRHVWRVWISELATG